MPFVILMIPKVFPPVILRIAEVLVTVILRRPEALVVVILKMPKELGVVILKIPRVLVPVIRDRRCCVFVILRRPEVDERIFIPLSSAVLIFLCGPDAPAPKPNSPSSKKPATSPPPFRSPSPPPAGTPLPSLGMTRHPIPCLMFSVIPCLTPSVTSGLMLSVIPCLAPSVISGMMPSVIPGLTGNLPKRPSLAPGTSSSWTTRSRPAPPCTPATPPSAPTPPPASPSPPSPPSRAHPPPAHKHTSEPQTIPSRCLNRWQDTYLPVCPTPKPLLSTSPGTQPGPIVPRAVLQHVSGYETQGKRSPPRAGERNRTQTRTPHPLRRVKGHKRMKSHPCNETS